MPKRPLAGEAAHFFWQQLRTARADTCWVARGFLGMPMTGRRPPNALSSRLDRQRYGARCPSDRGRKCDM